VADLDVVFVGTPDTVRPPGIKGIGEIGVGGVSAAIANAVYHATGRRIRSLPVTVEQLCCRPDEHSGHASPSSVAPSTAPLPTHSARRANRSECQTADVQLGPTEIVIDAPLEPLRRFECLEPSPQALRLWLDPGVADVPPPVEGVG